MEGEKVFGQLFAKKSFRYRCHECGDYHAGSPSFSFKYPTYYFGVPESERENRVQVSEDSCKIIPGTTNLYEASIYCIRVILEVAIKGAAEPFTWGVWVTQSKENFEKYIDTSDQDQSAEQSFGWLAVNMPFYNNTQMSEPLTHLECEVFWGTKGARPKISLWENEHQLSVDQHNGISWKRAIKIANQANSEFLRST